MVNRSRAKAYGILVAVFVLGATTGAGVCKAVIEGEYRDLASGDPEDWHRRKLEAMGRQLELSDEQQQAIGAIFRKHDDQRRRLMRTMIQSCGQPLEQHKAQVDAEVRAVLTPEQANRLEDLLKKHRPRW